MPEYAYIHAQCTHFINKLRIQDDFLFIKTFYSITKLKHYIPTSMVLHSTRLSAYKVQSWCETFTMCP